MKEAAATPRHTETTRRAENIYSGKRLLPFALFVDPDAAI